MRAIFTRTGSGPLVRRSASSGLRRAGLALVVLAIGVYAGGGVHVFGVGTASGSSPITSVTLPQIVQPPSMTWNGTWSSAAKYTPGNVVSYQGGSYVAIIASQGIAPVGAGTSQKAWSTVAAGSLVYMTGDFNGPRSLGIVHLAHFVHTRLLTLSLPAGSYETMATMGISNLDSDGQQFSCELDANSDNSLTGTVDDLIERLSPTSQTSRQLHAVVQLQRPGYVVLQCNTYNGNLLAPVLTASPVGSVIRQ